MQQNPAGPPCCPPCPPVATLPLETHLYHAALLRRPRLMGADFTSIRNSKTSWPRSTKTCPEEPHPTVTKDLPLLFKVHDDKKDCKAIFAQWQTCLTNWQPVVFLPKMSFFHQTITLSDDEEEEEERISFESEVLAQVSTHSPTYSQWMEALFLSMFLVAVFNL